MINIEKQILNINKSGDFFKELYAIYIQEANNTEDFYRAIVSLHNNGEIDLTGEILKFPSQNHEFFNAKNIFEKALPFLDIPIQKSMDCVRHIFQISKNDMSAGVIFLSFAEYCKKNENRVKGALKIINNDTSCYSLIPSVIMSGSKFNLDKYVKVAIEFAKHSDINICKKAIYSLGELQYKNHPNALNESFKTIKNIIKTTDDSELLSISIEVIFTLSVFNNELESETIQLIKIALKRADDNILYSASKLFSYQKEKISLELFNVLLNALEGVNHKHDITINNIDYGLQYLLKKNQDGVVIYLERVLIKNKNMSITFFDFLLRDFYQKHNKLLDQCITKWFIIGNTNLCKAVMDIIGFFNTHKIILSADIRQLKMQNNTTHLFVIRKAIGWLFIYQISAVSFIISIIEILDKNNIKTVESLLFNPILISYSTSVKEYLNSIKNQKTKTKKVISSLLTKLEKYHNDVGNARNIKELQPSQEHRESYSRLYNQQMSNAMLESKEDSLMSLIATEFTILYGNKSVLYHPELGDNPKDIRQEMNFQKFEHTIEYPSLDFIDPHGLDYMLRVFKNEQFVK
jgi:hypothetical protein